MIARQAPSSLERARDIARAADEARALEIVVLEVGSLLPLCGCFVICHGRSPLHAEAIVERVRELLKEEGVVPHHREGPPRGEWLLLDYVDVVLHVFSEQSRRFYDLERLWADAPRVEVELVRRSVIPPAYEGELP